MAKDEDFDDDEDTSDDEGLEYAEFADPGEATELTWAEDVLFVYQNLGRRIDPKLAGSPARWTQWKYYSNPKNVKDFLKAVVPKATEIKKKYDDAGKNDESVKKERKQIAELRGVLADAIAESAKITP